MNARVHGRVIAALAHARRIGMLLVAAMVISCGGSGGGDVLSQSGGAAPPVVDQAKLRVYVVVVDSLHPEEIGPFTPSLSALKAQSVFYEGARAILPAVTLANHVSMMTGVLPNKHGMVSNDFFDGTVERSMGDPALNEADHLFTRLKRLGPDVHTAAVLSWLPIWRAFDNEGNGCEPNKQCAADFHWEPFPVDPSPSDSARDAVTMDVFIGWLNSTPGTPQFAFVNMTDVDNAGHIDETGPLGGPPITRLFALIQTDLQIGRLMTTLQADADAWANTILLIVSDHVMDWSLLNAFINLRPVLDGAGFGSSEVATADNGGHESLYVLDTGGRPLRDVVEEISALVAAVEGVEHVVTDYTTPSRADLGLDHPNAGRLVLFAEDGFRFTDPDETANPLPGNHGHVTTQASTLMIVGGHPVLQGPCTVPLGFVPAALSQPVNAPGNLSIAPTVAALYGLPAPARGYDGSVLAEAFTPDCGQ